MKSSNLPDNYISTVADELLDECEFARQHSESFSQIAFAHIKRMSFSKAMFEEKTLLSARTFDRIKSNELENPTIETVMAICIGLELGIEQGGPLLEIAGYKLGQSHLHRAYRKILSSFKGRSIYECDEFLEELGLQPICKRALKQNSLK